MAYKAVALIIVLGLSVLLFTTLRAGNRAEAAGGNCYSSAQGPASPTICQ